MSYKYNDWEGPLEGLDEWVNSLCTLAKKKYGVDSDGDCPAYIHVIDRTKFRPSHYMDVPYEHKAKVENDLDNIEFTLLHNVTTAVEDLQKFMYLRKALHKDITR